MDLFVSHLKKRVSAQQRRRLVKLSLSLSVALVFAFHYCQSDAGIENSRSFPNLQQREVGVRASPFRSIDQSQLETINTFRQPLDGGILSEHWSQQTLMKKALDQKRPEDILVAQLATRKCLIAAGSTIDPKREVLSRMQKDSVESIRDKCPKPEIARKDKVSLEQLSKTVPSSGLNGLLASSGNLRSPQEQAFAFKQALATGRPELIAAIGADDLSTDAYKHLGFGGELKGSNPYDREMLAIAWQIWACEKTGTCESEASSFGPCLSHGQCSKNLANWPEENLFGPNSDSGYAANMSSRGYTQAARKQRWGELYSLVNKIVER